MILIDDQHNVYRVRFDQSKTNLRLPLSKQTILDSPITICTITGPGHLAIANVIKGPKDSFDGWVASKKSFQRAVNKYTDDPALKSQLWKGFLKGGVSRKEAGLPIPQEEAATA